MPELALKSSHPEVRREIAYMEENIALKEKLGKDASFERELVKSWKKYLAEAKFN